jgi:hypothetical protein
MKGKRYTTEDKIRILREADRGEKSVLDICREANISEVSFHRWKRQFGHMEVNETMEMGIAYKFIGTTDHSWSANNVNFDTDGTMTHAILANFTWKF